MAIDPSSIGTTSAASRDVVGVIEMLTSQPTTGLVLSTAKPPGQLLGWYNGASGHIELYVVGSSGIRLLRVV